jgi:hypothetical protein
MRQIHIVQACMGEVHIFHDDIGQIDVVKDGTSQIALSGFQTLSDML